MRNPSGQEQHSRKLPSSYSDVVVREADLEEAVEFAKTVIKHMETRENNLLAAQIGIESGSPSHGNFIAYGPDEEAVKRGKIGHIALKASTRLVTKVCHSLSYKWDDCALFVNKFSFGKTALGGFCNSIENYCTREESFFMYRSPDGRCNNEFLGWFGEAFTGYQRLLEPHYITLSYERRAQNKRPLPSPRAVSVALVDFKEEPHERYTMAVTQWGEFVEHDMSRPAIAVMYHSSHNIDCCSSNGLSLSPRYVHPFCAPIQTPSNDTYFNSINMQCMSYVRSIPAMRPDCSFGTPNQMNQVTHFLDGSQIYGSTFSRTASLRQFAGGRLSTTILEDRSFLPKSTNPTKDCQVTSEDATCFLSGDHRVNMQPQTVAMYTVWMREHNRLAKKLEAINPLWDDETIFQEARRIVIAEMQHITYEEWLPLILGSNYINRINSNSMYNVESDPTVSNSFATAAIRALTSLYGGNVSLLDESRTHSEQVLKLGEYFNKPDLILQKGNLDGIIRGFTSQSSGKVDKNFAQDVINKLYSNGDIGYDVLSLDIERGRDHGLPGYSRFRTLCGLPQPNDIKDLADTISPENIEALQRIYSHHSDIDLIVGGLMETPEPNSLFGPTFSCIIADQFLRSKQGDRYFHSNAAQPKPFRDHQLKEIGKVTMSRILCDNGDNIKKMQRHAFEVISDSNPLTTCDSGDIASVDLSLWMDSRERYTQ